MKFDKSTQFSKNLSKTKLACEGKIPVRILQSDHIVKDILDRHKNFLNFKPLSPLPNSPKRAKPKIISIVTVPKDNRLSYHRKVPINNLSTQGMKNHQEPEKIQSCNVHLKSAPLKFCIDCFFTNYFATDLEKSTELREFVTNFKKSPLSSFNKFGGIKNNFETKRIKSCVLHSIDQPSKFCIDCFLTNFFGTEFNQDSELKNSAIQFKNASFPSFDKSNFDFFINGTEIPLFSSTDEIKYVNQLFSCNNHVFSPPRNKPCESCFWTNWIKH